MGFLLQSGYKILPNELARLITNLLKIDDLISDKVY
jgi:hypothetical protein